MTNSIQLSCRTTNLCINLFVLAFCLFSTIAFASDAQSRTAPLSIAPNPTETTLLNTQDDEGTDGVIQEMVIAGLTSSPEPAEVLKVNVTHTFPDGLNIEGIEVKATGLQDIDVKRTANQIIVTWNATDGNAAPISGSLYSITLTSQFKPTTNGVVKTTDGRKTASNGQITLIEVNE